VNSPPPFTGDLNDDWKNLSAFWRQSERVLGSEVGPKWEMPKEHLACVLFAQAYPDSKKFLLERLFDPHPIVAAYAFKCLMRVTDLRPSDIPLSVRSRSDRIENVFHSHIQRMTLGEFISGYFEEYSSREELLDDQRRSLDWQQNELAEYERKKEQERREG
jgi:hypothetical protein